MEESYRELWDVIAEALLQLEDVPQAIVKARKGTSKCTVQEASEIQKTVVKNPEFQEYLKEYTEIAEAGLIDENNNTIRLKLNKIFGRAIREGKYDTAIKTLASVAKMLNIQDKQMEFNITFSFEPTEKTNLKLIKEKDDKKI